MHIRNLVKAGQSSHTISIPKSWLDKHELKKGDPLYLKEMPSGELMLSPKELKSQLEKKDIHINIEKKDISTIQREITSAYINNYNSIVLLGKNTDKIKSIREIIHTFVALEIAEVDSKKVVAKDLLNLDEVSIPKTIQRMDIILRSVMKDTLQVGGDKGLLDSLQYRDQDINRLYFMMFRILKSSLKDHRLLSRWNVSPHEVISLWYLIMNIESLSDVHKSIAKAVADIPKKAKQLDDLQQQLESNYKKVMKAYYASDKDTAQEVAATYAPFTKICNEFFAKNKSVEIASLVHHWKEACSLVCNIARIVIDDDKHES